MMKQGLATFLMLTIAFVLVPQSAMAQSGDRTMPMRTPDGQPDVSGIFTFRTLTPLQRPQQFEGRETLTAEAAAAFEASERRRQNRDLFDPEKGASGYAPRSEGGVLSYNEFWYERGIELTSDKRTSLVIDPPDGRLPPRVARPPDPELEQLSPAEAIARRYMLRLRRDDFDQPHELAKFAATAGISVEEFRRQFEHLIALEPPPLVISPDNYGLAKTPE